MIRDAAYIEGEGIAANGSAIASHWDLERQEMILQAAAAIGVVGPVRSTPSCEPAAARLALTLHWTLREPANRKN